MAPSMLVQVAALSGASAMQSLHHPTSLMHHSQHAHKSKRFEPYRQSLLNLGDVQYTGTIDVGGQKLQGILDTGSFELLVLSDECQVCGDRDKLFSSDNSESYKSGNESTQHNFGSGATYSREAFDTVAVGPLESRKQHFWQVYDAMMPILEESTFQAIVGVGPPDSARKLAEESQAPADDDEDYIEEAFVGHKKKHRSSNSSKSQTAMSSGTDPLSVCSGFGVRTFSVCMGKASGSEGYFVWNDKRPADRGEDFMAIEVSGDIHWATKMDNVQVGLDGQLSGGVFPLGCEDGCAAVLDSGTSLIAAPTEVIEKVAEAIQTLKEDCSNLGEMPDLIFTLSGKQFSLPPDAYIGQIVSADAPRLRDILHFRFHSRHYTCVPLFMNMDVQSQLGPMWILGLPFFRKYYTTFSYDLAGAKVQKQMAAAVANENCEPTVGTNLAAERRAMQPKRIELSQLRVPRWVEEAISKGTMRV